MAGAYYTDSAEIASAAQLYHYYLEPSVRLLAQNRVVDMGAIRPGLYGGNVGLLPGLHGDFMEKYEVCAMCAIHLCALCADASSLASQLTFCKGKLYSLQRTKNILTETTQRSTGPPRGFIPVYG